MSKRFYKFASAELNQKVEEWHDSDALQSLRTELILIKHLLEKWEHKLLQSDEDMVLRTPAVLNILKQIKELHDSFVKSEKSMGLLMDKSNVFELMGHVVEAVKNNFSDVDNFDERAAQLSSDLANLLGNKNE